MQDGEEEEEAVMLGSLDLDLDPHADSHDLLALSDCFPNVRAPAPALTAACSPQASLAP
jgi:hypothetical protein